VIDTYCLKCKGLETRTGLPTSTACIAYVISLGYACIVAKPGYYLFVDRTGKRPLHNKEMVWSLSEMRHAIKYGC
jgi:hypothetical protein